MSARIPMNGTIKNIMRTTDGGIRLELEMTGSWGTAPRPAVILLEPGHVGVLADFVGDILHEKSEDLRLAALREPMFQAPVQGEYGQIGRNVFAPLDQVPYEGDGYGRDRS